MGPERINSWKALDTSVRIDHGEVVSVYRTKDFKRERTVGSSTLR